MEKKDLLWSSDTPDWDGSRVLHLTGTTCPLCMSHSLHISLCCERSRGLPVLSNSQQKSEMNLMLLFKLLYLKPFQLRMYWNFGWGKIPWQQTQGSFLYCCHLCQNCKKVKKKKKEKGRVLEKKFRNTIFVPLCCRRFLHVWLTWRCSSGVFCFDRQVEQHLVFLLLFFLFLKKRDIFVANREQNWACAPTIWVVCFTSSCGCMWIFLLCQYFSAEKKNMQSSSWIWEHWSHLSW